MIRWLKTKGGEEEKKNPSQKKSKWEALAREHRVYDVVPLVFETTGRRGEETVAFFRHMARNTQHYPMAPSLESLWLQPSVTMVKSNVQMLREAVRVVTGVHVHAAEAVRPDTPRPRCIRAAWCRSPPAALRSRNSPKPCCCAAVLV